MGLRGALYRLLAVLLALAFVSATAEVVLRLLPRRGAFVSTAIPPSSQALGPQYPDFRDRQRPGPKAAGRFRILASGDSFVWGAGVYPADTYSRRLERRLGGLVSDHEFEVVSWSRSGWSTKQVWDSLRGRLRGLNPDLVLLGFTLNDPEPSDRLVRQSVTEELLRREPDEGWSRTLYERSRLYGLFWERFENRRQRRAFDSYYHRLYEGPYWDECRQAIAELREATEALGVPLVMVVMPVFDSQFDHQYRYRELHRKIARVARELEIPVLDLLATYRRVDARRLAVEPFTDPHPNELAHRIAADELTEYLLREGLVPASYPSGVKRIKAVRRR